MRWTPGEGEAYAARFDALAASGADVHGEATFCEALAAAPARVLDAGCGTGRVAIRLSERGHECVGVDLDASMLDVARRRAPDLRWVRQDLASLDLGETFDLVVMAGNVLPLVEPGTEPTVVRRVAAHLARGGVLVAGFGLDRSHLPPQGAVLTIGDYDSWCADAGLTLAERFATWDRSPYEGGGYAVSVHHRDP